MNPEEIKVGGIYSNGKKRETIRKVTMVRDGYSVNFEVLKGPYMGWSNLQIELRSFARWAHHEVNPSKENSHE